MEEQTARMAIVVTLLWSGTSLAASPEDSEVRCEAYGSAMLKKKITYCVHRSQPEMPAEPGEPVVYFMHGKNGNAKSWIRDGYAESLPKVRARGSLRRFTVVSFDTEGFSFFSDWKKIGKGTKSYETWFKTEFMPMIEAKYQLCSERACRAVIGVSMGGFGAIKTALRNPDLFAVTAANSPALPPFRVGGGFWQYMRYFARHPIGVFQGAVYLKFLRRVFPKGKVYGDLNDPVYLSQRFAGEIEPEANWPSVYFDVGDRDSYGLQEGHKRLRAALDFQRLPYTSTWVPGGKHDPAPSEREAALEFVSRSLQ